MQVFRHSALRTWTSVIGGVAILGCTLAMAGLAFTSFAQEPGLAMFLLLIAVGMAFLADLVWRDGRGKIGWRIAVANDDGRVRIELFLPTHRSYLTRSSHFSGRLGADDVRAVEGREETYATLGMSFSVTAYRICLVNGQMVFLGEDRPIPRTGQTETLVGEAAEAIAGACGLKVRWLRPATGDAGVLAAWGVKSPPWPDPR